MEFLLGVKGKVFVLVSDRFELSLMRRIGSVPEVFGLEDIEYQTVVKIKKTNLEEVPRVQGSAFHFELTDSQSPLE
jgi:hypothetical protein